MTDDYQRMAKLIMESERPGTERQISSKENPLLAQIREDCRNTGFDWPSNSTDRSVPPERVIYSGAAIRHAAWHRAKLLKMLDERDAEIARLRSSSETFVRPPHWHCRTHGNFDAMVAVGCPECMRLARQALIQIQRETWASPWEAGQAAHKLASDALDPSTSEKAGATPAGAEERLANAVNAVMRVKALSNQALVDMALNGCFSDTTATADAVLHEMCSRLHPGWQNEDPKTEWFCACRTPLPNSTAVCPKCFPDGMTK